MDVDAGAIELSNEVRVQYGRELQYETAQAPLPQEPAMGPDGFAPEVVDRAAGVDLWDAGFAGPEGVSG